MLSTRLRTFQRELHTHRRWLSGFLQRSQTSTFSTSQRYALAQKQDEKQLKTGKRLDRPGDEQRIRKDGKFKIRNIQWGGRFRPEEEDANAIIADLRRKLASGNIVHVVEDYGALNDSDKGTLTHGDVRGISQVLHQAVRKEKQSAANQHRQSKVPELVDFAEVLVRDIKKERLATSGKAYVHLIGIFKESGSRERGVQFWNWLVEQDETVVNVDCYGAAIELLAIDGKPLPELEALYEEALGRFPGNFASYHLSPSAVLPDREQPFMIGGIPISLLQGILTARLLNGDARNAYLALDTALRILPDQVPIRMFWVFLAERPVEEAYTAFALACRGGITPSGSYYRSILGAIRTHASLNSPASHALAVRAMLSTTHFYIGSGGKVGNNSVNELVIAATQFLRVEGVAAFPAQEKRKLVDGVMELVRGLFEMFARYGAQPSIPAFNSIITNLGGFGASKQTIGIALKDADALGLSPTEVTWRSILAVAGMFQDKSLVEKTWGYLRDSRIENHENPRMSDFHAVVKPAHLTGAVQFASAELDKFRDVMEPNEYETILARLQDPTEADVYTTEDEAVNIDDVLAEIEKVKADIEIIKTHTEGSPAVQDFSQQTLPITLQPAATSSLNLPDAQMEKIYDDFTTISNNTPNDSLSQILDVKKDSVAAKSKTGIDFGTLRYENWKAMNSLLEMAERNDAIYEATVDEAIKAGVMAPGRITGLVGNGKEKVVSWGLSSVVSEKSGGEGVEVGEEVTRVKAEIGRLRRGKD